MEKHYIARELKKTVEREYLNFNGTWGTKEEAYVYCIDHMELEAILCGMSGFNNGYTFYLVEA